MNRHRSRVWWALAATALFMTPSAARAQNTPDEKSLEVYGFAMLDIGHDFKTIHPDWYDTMRVTKLPSFDGEFGKGNDTFAGVRQSRFGVRSTTPTDLGQLKTIFEFEMFGTGVDAGQTTIRLRHAYGELGKFGAGQYWSPFMDIDVFPNSVEYWGPNGMAFFRNVQFRWMPIQGDTRMTIALERPGASGDQGVVSDYIGGDLAARFPLPDLSAEYRMGRDWGYVEAAGIVRQINWDDMDPTNANGDLSGEATGWGLNFTTNVKTAERGTIRAGVVYGEGIENYMNDAPVDVAPEVSGPNPTDVDGVALPVLGISAFYDITWNERWTSTVGYSMVDIDNSNGQAGTAFQTGHYALGNLMFYPVPNVMMGGEVQWGDRENMNGYTSDDFRVQFSAKYNFATMIGGQ